MQNPFKNQILLLYNQIKVINLISKCLLYEYNKLYTLEEKLFTILYSLLSSPNTVKLLYKIQGIHP